MGGVLDGSDFLWAVLDGSDFLWGGSGPWMVLVQTLLGMESGNVTGICGFTKVSGVSG